MYTFERQINSMSEENKQQIKAFNIFFDSKFTHIPPTILCLALLLRNIPLILDCGYVIWSRNGN